MHFNNKVYIITGSSQGIGAALGRQLLQHNANVVFNGRSDLRNKNLDIDQYIEDKKALYIKADISVKSNCEYLIQETLQCFGRIDGIILNAGISCYGAFDSLNEDVVKKMIDVNILGITWITQLAIPELIKTRGSILFISSLASIRGLPNYSMYSAVKMAMNGIAQCLQIELKSKNVYVGLSFVGFTQNESSKKTYGPDGVLEVVEDRGKFRPMSREKLAEKLLNQIQKQHKFKVYSALGKLGWYLNRLMPGLYAFIMLRNYKRENQV